MHFLWALATFSLTVHCLGVIFFDLLFVISAGLYRCFFRPPVPVDLQLEQAALKMPLRVTNLKSNEFLINGHAPAGASLVDNSSDAKTPACQLEWLAPASRRIGATSQHAEITACADDSQEMEESGAGSSLLQTEAGSSVPLKPGDQLAIMSAKAKKLKPLLALPSVSKETEAKVSVSVPALPGPDTSTKGAEKKIL